MAILNVTPDSFYDGGRYADEAGIVKRARQVVDEGATFIDIGGYSSRPGAEDIPPDEELRRVLHAIRIVRREAPELAISVDTFRSQVAEAAVESGASIVNDISAGALDSKMLKTIARLRIPYVAMHMKGNPQNMMSLATYDNVVTEILEYFANRVHQLAELGINDVIIDPGFGFSKTRETNFELLQQLELLKVTGKILMAGLSRKSMIWKTLGVQPENALNGTTVLNTVALLKGADILRVHDVREAMEAITLTVQLRGAGPAQ